MLRNSFQEIAANVIVVASSFIGILFGGALGVILGIIFYLFFAIPTSVLIANLGKLIYEVLLDIRRVS